MKATGIIRRIDDLGRIVLPKEIRKNLKIKEGDMLEIYVQDNNVITLEKFEPMDTLANLADKYAETLAAITGLTVCITTDSYILSSAGPQRKEYIKKDLSNEVIKVLDERITWNTKNNSNIKIKADDIAQKYTFQIIAPIIDDGAVVGSVLVFSTDSNRTISDEDIKIAKLLTTLLIKHME